MFVHFEQKTLSIRKHGHENRIFYSAGFYHPDDGGAKKKKPEQGMEEGYLSMRYPRAIYPFSNTASFYYIYQNLPDEDENN